MLPAVLMLHGTGGHWETFVSNLGPFSAHFRCVAIDMVGNGFSGKPDVDYEIDLYVEHAFAVLDALAIERSSIIGTSLGAWVAARSALTHPDRVDKLVLMSPAGLVATESNMQRIRAERTAAVDDPSWERIKGLFDHLIADERNRIPDMVAVRQAIYRLPETRGAIDHVLILQDPLARDRNLISEEEWSSIAAPTLVVASGQDDSEYESTARRVATLIPNAEVLEMPYGPPLAPLRGPRPLQRGGDRVPARGDPDPARFDGVRRSDRPGAGRRGGGGRGPGPGRRRAHRTSRSASSPCNTPT